MLQLAICSLAGGLALVATATAIAVTYLRHVAAHVERQQRDLEDLIERIERALGHVTGEVRNLDRAVKRTAPPAATPTPSPAPTRVELPRARVVVR